MPVGKSKNADIVHYQADSYVRPAILGFLLERDHLCFLRIEGRIFGDVPINLEVRLSVEDSPNSAGVTIDAIRCCKLALDRGYGGVLIAPSAYFMKHPPCQLSDTKALQQLEIFICDEKDEDCCGINGGGL